jgi:hypothetical protein
MSAVRPHGPAGRWALGLLFLLPGLALTADESAAVVGKCVSAPGTLLVRNTKSKNWKALKPGDPVHAGDTLVALPGNEAIVNMERTGLRLTLAGLLPEWHRPPATESRVQLYPDKGGQADFALESGRVVLTNLRPKKEAGARIHILKIVWAITLDEPKTIALLQRTNSWPVGVPLTKKVSSERQPFTHAFLLLREGEGHLGLGTEQFGLRPLTLYQWTNAGGPLGPLPLKEVPSFLKPLKERPPDAEAARVGAARLRKLLLERSVAEGLRKGLHSREVGTRHAAIVAAAALSEVGLLLDALGDDQHADNRSGAVVGLRHWLGQKAEHAGELYQALLDRHFKAGQAETVLDLLHSFSPQDRGRAETYETLIAYLQHDKLPIRELAAWQLEHMVPQGKKLGYDAAASAAQRARAVAAWRRLIPEGHLPPAEKKQP